MVIFSYLAVTLIILYLIFIYLYLSDDNKLSLVLSLNELTISSYIVIFLFTSCLV